MATTENVNDSFSLEIYTEDFLTESDLETETSKNSKTSEPNHEHAPDSVSGPLLRNGVSTGGCALAVEDDDEVNPGAEALTDDARDNATPEPADTADNPKSLGSASPLERFSQAFSMLGRTAGDISSGVTTAKPFAFLTTPSDPKLSPTDLKSRRFSPVGNPTSAREQLFAPLTNATQGAEAASWSANRGEWKTLKVNTLLDSSAFSENLPLLHITQSGDDISERPGTSGPCVDQDTKAENGETVRTEDEKKDLSQESSSNPGVQPTGDCPKSSATPTETTEAVEGTETSRDTKKRHKSTSRSSSRSSLDKQRSSSLKGKPSAGTTRDKQLTAPPSDSRPRTPVHKSNSRTSLTRFNLKFQTNGDDLLKPSPENDSVGGATEDGSCSREKLLDDNNDNNNDDNNDDNSEGNKTEDQEAGLQTDDDDLISEDKCLATFFVGNDSGPSSRQNSYPDDGTLLTNYENGTANGKGDGFEDEPVTMRYGRKTQTSILLGSLFMILSGLYGILIVVLGAVIPLTEIFVTEEGTAFEAFYIYLYSVSIAFLIYVYVYLLRRNRLRTEFLTRTLSRSISFTGRWASSWAAKGSDRNRTRKRMVSLDESNHHTGTFYLRLGVLGFGIGSMIHSGLNFGKFFGSITEGQCSSGLALLVKPLLHLIFTFSQLYFIFMNSKMCIHRKKVLARFGLMHMAATNICVWFRSIVVETLHEIHHHHHAHHAEEHQPHPPGHGADHGASDATYHTATPLEGDHSDDNLTVSVGRKLMAAVSSANGSGGGLSSGGMLELKCSWDNMMGKAVDSAGPYLYPCTIEYSLMCAGILYVMWSNVGTRPRLRTNSEIEDVEQHLKQHRMSVDCTSSSRGLFLGIFLTVCAIISIIAFYVMVGQPHLRSEALLLTHLSETLIYCLTTLALLMATLRMRHLLFHSDHTSDLEETLIIIAYTGLLAFNIFSLIAAILMAPAEGAALTIISNFTMMLQSAFQTIFMLAGDRLSARSVVQERKKPGREYVTFLLLCNFAMWIINTFETQKPEHNPLQVAFYGPEAWSIFSHISVPLGIFYRFHSTVCLSNIWKNAWKMRKHH
ncbi:hypothetical protein ACOMHN_064683 [Nucella lapillus]